MSTNCACFNAHCFDRCCQGNLRNVRAAYFTKTDLGVKT